MPKLLAVKDYIIRHGEAERVGEETDEGNDTLSESTTVDGISYPISTNADYETLKNQLAVWHGFFIDINEDMLQHGTNEIYANRKLTPDYAKQLLLNRYTEGYIWDKFNVPEQRRDKITVWYLIFPETISGWLRIGYHVREADGSLSLFKHS